MKNCGFEGPKSMQNPRQSMKKTCLKTRTFLTSIFFDFSSILIPKLLPSYSLQFPSDPYLQDVGKYLGPKRRPRGPKSVPRGLQEGILRDFGLHFERFSISFLGFFFNFLLVFDCDAFCRRRRQWISTGAVTVQRIWGGASNRGVGKG